MFIGRIRIIVKMIWLWVSHMVGLGILEVPLLEGLPPRELVGRNQVISNNGIGKVGQPFRVEI